ncbi:hypothetical protein SAMN05421776_11756 [Nocardia farcinica]|uniref:Uncharacterized protein n=1 Tax=Nocardia farcinica TaxID=37329 RepID=A0A0H5NX53_NOCFR|nr:hypothetical protein [Nocardia farcinica]AXK86596.1 hypothetical protein DXT66_14045 [Nocardia farcinica]PFW99063.1 hypothetical protein CJ469_05663 [Nocardia farcinica]PFX06101.1 hypothetical protein CJ468_04961 [Nocardia farcinica]CRY79888.1 Uncharacterised protein [Nocardia farcinica]SIT33650.1 hypothetical protein SAMN05421776_11756 [Nocardia farcinica]
MAVDTVPASKASKRENRYSFRLKDGGKVYSVPKLQYMSGDGSKFIAEQLGKGLDEVSFTRRLLSIECPEAAAELDSLHADQVLWLSERWTAASAITVGESEGSAES